ncbi:MAG: DUF5655 domain-containing protein [Gemmataceae bacterium]
MPRAVTKSKSLYSVHPGVAMVQRWIEDLPVKTGRSLKQWIAHIRSEGPADEKECRTWLKDTYGHGTNTAWWLAERAHGNPMGLMEEDPKQYLAMAYQYVEDMYAGSKAGLRPLYEELLGLGLGLAKDVRACPCKTIVPLYRNHVFAQIKPATKTRIDFGLALKDTPVSGKLIDTGGFAKKDRITHKFEITSSKDITADVKKWLKRAYAMDA